MSLLELSISSGIGVILCALTISQTHQLINTITHYRERSQLLVNILESLHLMNDTVSQAKAPDPRSGAYRAANSSAIHLKQKGQFVIRKGVASLNSSDAFYVYTPNKKDLTLQDSQLVGFFAQQQGYGRARENLLYMVRESQKNKLFHVAVANGIEAMQIQLGVWQDKDLLWLEPHEILENRGYGAWAWSDVVALRSEIQWRLGQAQITTQSIWASFQ